MHSLDNKFAKYFLHATAWQVTGVVLLVVYAVTVLAFSDTLVSLVEIWIRSETFMHGFLIFPISAYLMWRKRDTLIAIQPEIALGGLALLFAALFFWLVAYLGEVQAAKQFALIGIIIAIAYTLCGADVFKIILFPAMYLFFAVPFGEFLVPTLQDFTAEFTVLFLRFSGIPVYLEGRMLYIPSGTFEVAVACSGIRYLIASLALGCLYAYVTYRSMRKRLLFVGLSIIVPLLANGFRAYGIVMLAHLSNYKLAVGVDHLVYGWVFFGLVMLVLFWMGGRFSDKPLPSDSEVSSSASLDKPQHNSAIQQSYPPVYVKRALLALSMATGLVIVPPIADSIDAHAGGSALTLSAQSLNNSLPFTRWTVSHEKGLDWGVDYKGASAEYLHGYTRDDMSVYLYIASYANQAQSTELINSENKPFDSNVWKLLREHRHTVKLGDVSSLSTYQYQLKRKDDEFLLIWKWYIVGPSISTSPITTKLNEIWKKLTLSYQGSSVVMLAAHSHTGFDQAESSLSAFVGDNWIQLRAAVTGVATEQ